MAVRINEQTYNLRMPKNLYKELKHEKERRPHMSINAIIIEAIIADLHSNDCGEVKSEPTKEGV